MATYRTKILNLFMAALKAYKDLNETHIYSPGDWPSDPEKNTVLQVGRLINESKASVSRGQAEFTTTIYITVDGRLARDTGEKALRDIERLSWKVEQAILTDYNINLNIQQFPTVKTVQEIDSSSGLHVAQFAIEFATEIFQSQEEYYTPTQVITPTQVAIVLDAANVYDPSGTYTGTESTTQFPDSITPAPRTLGPDGRVEGLIIVDVNQT